jgi:hypothetical protein
MKKILKNAIAIYHINEQHKQQSQPIQQQTLKPEHKTLSTRPDFK